MGLCSTPSKQVRPFSPISFSDTDLLISTCHSSVSPRRNAVPKCCPRVGPPRARGSEKFQKTFLGKRSENTVENPRPMLGATSVFALHSSCLSEFCLSDLDAPAL